MLTVVEEMFDSTEFQFEFADTKITSVADIMEIGGNQYALTTQLMTMEMVYSKNDEITVEELVIGLKEMKPFLDLSFGEENMNFIVKKRIQIH